VGIPRILIVEDDAILAAYLDRVLSQLGYQVLGMASSGEEAVRIALAQQPDAILMDVNLRTKMTGIQAAVEIHQQANIPVIYLTAYADDALFQQAKITGAYAYLVKPMRERELHASLEMALYKHGVEKRIAHYNQVLRAARDVNHLITREHIAQRLREEACEILAGTRGYKLVWIGEMDGNRVRPLAVSGSGKDFLELVTSMATAEQAEVLPSAVSVRENQVILCSDLLQDERFAPWREAVEKEHFVSSVAIPMQQAGKQNGVLCVYADLAGIFDEEEISLLMGVAGDIALSLKAIEEEVARKKAEEALRQSEARYRLLADNMSDTIWLMDLKLHILYASPSVFHQRGFSNLDELNAVPFDQQLSPDSYRRVMELYQQLIAREHDSWLDFQKSYTFDLEYYRKDGSKYWSENTFTLILDDDSRPVNILGSGRNITARKQVELERQASEERYHGLLESLDSIVALLDEEGCFLYINEVGADQFGEAPESLVGKMIADLFPEPYSSEQLKNVQRVIREDQSVIDENQSLLEGNPRWYRTSIQPIHDETGRPVLALLNSTDITQLKNYQNELKELNRTLEQRVRERTAEVEDLYNNAPCGYHSLDGDGCMAHINDTELHWLGYIRAEVIGRPFREFITEASREIFQKNFPDFKRSGSITDLAFEMVRKDRTTFPVLISATAAYDSAGNYIMSRSTVFDDTERKKNELALRESEACLRQNRDELQAANIALEKAARLKDEFLASVSHELRTPLTGILGLSEALQLNTYGVLNEKQLRALVNIESSGRHLLDLINDILDVSKIESGKLDLNLGLCSLREICEAGLQLTKEIAFQKHQPVKFSMFPERIFLYADARRLKQILVNLLSNAVKFTPEGGELGLDIQGLESRRLVQIIVWDKGIGIKPEDLDKLFRAFVQVDSSLSRQYSGTGLGLFLVRRMVELHGGSIKVESTPGVGSRFIVMLPWSDEPYQNWTS
jgi:PAS domain S-box-containing protein